MTGVVRCDALTLPLASSSVDLIVTSPPYFALRSYKDDGEHYDGQLGSEATPAEFLAALWAVTAECWRVLKPSGSLLVNLGDKYVSDNRGSNHSDKRRGKYAPASDQGFVGRDMARRKSLLGLPWRYAIGCIDGEADPEGVGWILRSEIIWDKPNGLPESVDDRVRRTHEQWFHFTKEPRYFTALNEIREAHAEGAAEAVARDQRPELQPDIGGTGEGRREWRSGINPLGKLPGSVWTIPSEPLNIPTELGLDHFAAFPTEWPRRLILAFSPSGVCTKCGEGRRPAVRVEHERYRDSTGRNTAPRPRWPAMTVSSLQADTWRTTAATTPKWSAGLRTRSSYKSERPRSSSPSPPTTPSKEQGQPSSVRSETLAQYDWRRTSWRLSRVVPCPRSTALAANPYAKKKIAGRTYLAHRLVWEAAHGPIPDGMLVHHKDDDKRNNALENLELMTHAQHSAHHNDKHPRIKSCEACGTEYEPPAKHRGRSKTCSDPCFQLLMKTKRNNAKLTREDYGEIQRRISSGESQKAIAADFGVSAPTVTRVKSLTL